MASPLRQEGVAKADLDVADDLSAQLLRFMRLVGKATKSMVAEQGANGVEWAAYAILFHLIHDGPQRTSKLAESLHAEISTISRQSSALVQHGLVERQADPEDGRACLLAPTAEGLRVFEEGRRHRNEWLAGVLADWPENERRLLSELLDRLNNGLEAHTPQFCEPNKGA